MHGLFVWCKEVKSERFRNCKNIFSITWSIYFYDFKEFLNWRNFTSLDWYFINYIFSPEDLRKRHCYCYTLKMTQTSLDFSYTFAHTGINVSLSLWFVLLHRFAGSHKGSLPLPRLWFQEQFFFGIGVNMHLFYTLIGYILLEITLPHYFGGEI